MSVSTLATYMYCDKCFCKFDVGTEALDVAEEGSMATQEKEKGLMVYYS